MVQDEFILTVSHLCCIFLQDIYVVCDESDIAFWADSESDDNDRSDDDIIEAVSVLSWEITY